MEGCKPVSTSLELGTHLDSSQQLIADVDKEKMVNIPYRSAIGSLMYLSTCTRPDISQTRVMLEKGKLRGVDLVMFFSVLEQQFHGEAQ